MKNQKLEQIVERANAEYRKFRYKMMEKATKKELWEGAGKIKFGIYACSPENSSFKAVFTDMKLMECQWNAHNGQKPDE